MHLPDLRLENVLSQFTQRVAAKQSLIMRQLANCRNEEIQFGRFLANPRVSLEALDKNLYAQCAADIEPNSHLLLLEDSSQLALGLQRSIDGLGKLAQGLKQGFYLHPVLTLDATTGACHGIAAVEFRNRPQVEDGLSAQQRKIARDQLYFEDKESYRWQSSIAQAIDQLPSTTQKTAIMDREGDIYAVIVGLHKTLGVDYLIRSRLDRLLANPPKLYQTIQAWPLALTVELDLPATDGRSAHLARLEVRFGQVMLKKSASKTRQALPPNYPSWVVWVREVAQTVVNQESPIDWVLLTSHPIQSAQQALVIVGYYKQRWNVEQVFRVLKTKCLRFESSQLSNYEKLRKLMVVALLGSVKILQLIRARQGHTPQGLGVVFSEEEATFLGVLKPQLAGRTSKQQNPHPKESLAFGAWLIAGLGGWSGYESQRPPGPIDFFTGLQRFYDQWQGFLVAQAYQKDVYTP
ncbi:IS4 family transposase [Spirosoma sp. HMF3257]|uniref:IS4 family transposase n=1 Tax=Spirosoma telluris TaxID=2183553 RepID=A0A327NDE5_9BACT|nr:IS4 family transposase [Spirosoma telluris]RAI73092.1 IS4 family transposase [Spirosoma telluris]